MRRLSELATGEKAYISKIEGRGAFRRRLGEMGFVRGKEIKVVKNAPLLDPIEYLILGYKISLRRSEASSVIVSSEPLVVGPVEFDTLNNSEINNTIINKYKEKGRVINIAFVGNPNAGKTSIFNFASGGSEHTGNYSGVTVDSKTARIEHDGYILNITDLPGTYSISAFSPEELYVRDFIVKNVPDIVINVVDASNLERNLFLTSQLIDMDLKVVLALNMYDELQRNKCQLDFVGLGKLLGIPIVPTVGAKGRGINELFQKVVNLYNDKEPIHRHIHINYGEEIEKSIHVIQTEIKQPSNYEITDKVSSRFVALKLLERDRHIEEYVLPAENFNKIKEIAKAESERLKALYSEDTVTLITDAKYGFIGGALKETYIPGTHAKREVTEILDAFLTHKLFGFPVFFAFLWLMFTSTFELGSYPMDWIDSGISLLSDFLTANLAEGSFKDLLIDGIIGGVGGVIVFLPNILLLFLFISFLEDSGYMARAVFIMDRVMHRIGLHGKSFISLIMGFGCNVPAIMSTRTIEDRNNRLLTILINPFMSCSARLPVYLLIIGAVFPDKRGTVLFGVYLTGIFLAIIMALFFKKTLLKGEDTPFVMELPPYRMPTLRSTTKHMWTKGSQYLKKMGGVILIASVILWALGYFPRNIQNSPELINQQQSIEHEILTAKAERTSVDSVQLQNLNSELIEVNRNIEAERLEKSYIGRLGKAIEPVIRPLGFDWKLGISLLTGIAAKEVVVSTLGVLYQADDSDLDSSLPHRIKNDVHLTGKNKGKPVMNSVVGLSFIIFTLIYFPCVAVIAAVKRETGSVKWAVFVMVYTTGLAWILSFLVYNLGKLFL
ncbi:MAG: ferrous iron transport protein B [Bacteroidales bacterium]|nr:ferrous iron transport protein B [Bacteroidales bacterium]MBN2819665.1 ferrous iron transport protein B [Bacteroidales bacterium]